MRFSLLGSGSSGNVAYFEAASAVPSVARRTRLFVDAGLSKTEVERRLQKLPSAEAVTLGDIDGVLITHEHNDHAQHAKSLKRPLWATAGTRLTLSLDATLVRAGDTLTIGAFSVTAVGIPHDAAEAVGYVLDDGTGRVGIVTDCGHDAPEVAQGFAGCDALILETNYDVTMLNYGPYPPSLKRRVGGRLGHLSNEQAASLLKQIMQLGPAPKLVIAAHISQANNRPQLAKSALDRVLGRELGRPSRVMTASPRGTPIFAVEGGRVRVEPMRNEQLAFSFNPQPQLPI
jgi:phosphoribosyl 1,2-cyclic phosphodiesterase